MNVTGLRQHGPTEGFTAYVRPSRLAAVHLDARHPIMTRGNLGDGHSLSGSLFWRDSLFAADLSLADELHGYMVACESVLGDWVWMEAGACRCRLASASVVRPTHLSPV